MKAKIAVGFAVLVLLFGCGSLLTGASSMGAILAATGGGGNTQLMPGGLSSKVPAEMVPWILRSAAQCQPPLTPALLAAQLNQESGFDPNSTSSAGAQGVAQIMPSNQDMIHDDDGNGVASAMDTGDAIMAMGRMMCSFLPRLNMFSGDQLLGLMLASYNAGPYAVLPGPCSKATRDPGPCQPKIPPYPETQNYVRNILASVNQFTAPGMTNGALVAGAWVEPITGGYMVGAVFHQVGSHWHMCGRHTGYDYSVAIGTNVQAIHSGTVVHAADGGTAGGTGSAYGNQIIVDHGGGLRSYYDHLSSFAVQNGQQVQTGQVIGVSGATGNITGPHLHLEITMGGNGMPTCDQFLDPHAYIAQHAHDGVPQAATSATGLPAAAVAAAKTQLGVPYVYGGGDLTGPSSGGFDCSSLVRYAWYQASGGKVILPRVTTDQIAATTTINESDLRPGDLLFFQTGLPGDWSHVGMYIGNGQMIHAPHTGDHVRIVSITSGYYRSIPTAYRRVQA